VRCNGKNQCTQTIAHHVQGVLRGIAIADRNGHVVLQCTARLSVRSRHQRHVLSAGVNRSSDGSNGKQTPKGYEVLDKLCGP
jgi:hypothetical protein